MSLRPRKKALCLVALLFALGRVALGHDVQASWATVRLLPRSCELTVRLHAEAVHALIQDAAPGATFEPENMERVMPALRSFGKTLYEVSADGQTIAATGADASVVFDEIVFHLVYPCTPGGALRLRATHLTRLPPDFIAHVKVLDDTGKSLANHVLRQNHPLVELEPPTPTAQSGGDGRGSFLSFLNGYRYLLLLPMLLVVSLIALWLFKRRIF